MIKKIYLILFLGLSLVSCAKNKADAQKEEAFAIPTKMVFAGEEVPLNDDENKERLERELIQNVYKHSSTILILKRAGRWEKQIKAMLREQGIPEDFFYIAAIESDLDPYAMSGKARGFWQFTDSTASDFKLEVTDYVDMRVDPVTSTEAACRYFKKAYSKYNNWTLAAASFNPGMSAIQNFLNSQQVQSYYDLYLYPETYRYIFRVLALKLIMENPTKYGFNLSAGEIYKPLIGKKITISSNINLITFCQENKINLKTLKRYNPWLKFNRYDYTFNVGAGKSYTFMVPE